MNSGQTEKSIPELLCEARATILSNRHRMESLTDRALAARERGDLRSAAAWCQAAAQVAFLHHGGQFVSTRLEELLFGLAVRWPRPSNQRQPSRHVLHVASGLFQTGGHSRLLANWARNDSSRRHSLVVTMQAREFVPTEFKELIHQRGGETFALEECGDDLTLRAAKLVDRTIALAPDTIIIHAHPHDIIPSLAFSRRTTPVRIGYMNHTDHKFWLGRDSADMFVHFRASTVPLSFQRRGIPESRCALLPLPLSEPTTKSSRAAVRRKLAVSDDSPLILSVATEYKYANFGPFRIANVVRAMVDAVPEAIFVFVGPGTSGQFAELLSRFPRNMKVLGRRTDVADLLAASDIYLDSYPLGSATSSLDAMLAGLPVVSNSLPGLDNRFYQADGGALDSLETRTDDLEVATGMLEELARNPEKRKRVGDNNQHEATRLHCGSGWLTSLEAVYSALAEQGLEPISPPAEVRTIDDELNVLLFDAGPVPSEKQASIDISRHLSLAERLQIQVPAAVHGQLPITSALPPIIRRWARKIRSAVKQRGLT